MPSCKAPLRPCFQVECVCLCHSGRESVCRGAVFFCGSAVFNHLTFGDLVLTLWARREMEMETRRRGALLMDEILTGQVETQTPSVLTEGSNWLVILATKCPTDRKRTETFTEKYFTWLRLKGTKIRKYTFLLLPVVLFIPLDSSGMSSRVLEISAKEMSAISLTWQN